MPDLTQAAAIVRKAVNDYLERQSAIDERAFNQWRDDTLFPDVVNRTIWAIGEAA